MSSPTSLSAADTGWAGHPRGLATLFLTEMWERFSYYGMRAFLILYMTAPAAAGGLGFADRRCRVDLRHLHGQRLGRGDPRRAGRRSFSRRSIAACWSAAIIIALGHFALAFKALPFFYLGPGLIVVGTGLLKPNVSTLVGSLYEQGDTRRDAGFSVFYMGINLGAFLGPLIAGYLAQRVDWHIGFRVRRRRHGVRPRPVRARASASCSARHRAPRRRRPGAAAAKATSADPSTGSGARFTAEEWKRIGAIVVFFLFATIFWGAYEQAGSTLSLFADRYTRHEVFGFGFPSSWFQTVQPVCVILLAPVFAWLWLRLGRASRRVPPSSPSACCLSASRS